MITQEDAKYLLKLPKVIAEDTDATVDLNQEKNRLNLYSPEDDEWKFILQINSNKKISFRISIHHQENNYKEGLFRVDFKSGHRNPEHLNAFVPDFVKPYAGVWFENESHVHLFVEGYRNLAWAVPLKNYDDFPVKEVDSHQDFLKAVRSFTGAINLISEFAIQKPLL